MPVSGAAFLLSTAARFPRGPVVDLHAGDVASGAEVIFANTFGLCLYLLNDGISEGWNKQFAGAIRLARTAAPSCRVFASVPPLLGTEERALQFGDAARAVYRHVYQTAVECGADGVVCETLSHPADVRAVLDVVPHSIDAGMKELWLSLSAHCGASDSPATLEASDQRLQACLGLIRDLGAPSWLGAVGVNCGVGAGSALDRALLRKVAALNGAVRRPMLYKPGRLPGKTTVSPQLFAQSVVDALCFLHEDQESDWLVPVVYVGGCCGTTSEDIAALRTEVGVQRIDLASRR
jgi:methionine synthase I (cobalamin-dependent)